jgi:hypothetical protein
MGIDSADTNQPSNVWRFTWTNHIYNLARQWYRYTSVQIEAAKKAEFWYTFIPYRLDENKFIMETL